MNDNLNSYFKNEYRMSALDFFGIESGQKKILNMSIAKNTKNKIKSKILKKTKRN